jgi:hypothetical protein
MFTEAFQNNSLIVTDAYQPTAVSVLESNAMNSL